MFHKHALLVTVLHLSAALNRNFSWRLLQGAHQHDGQFCYGGAHVGHGLHLRGDCSSHQDCIGRQLLRVSSSRAAHRRCRTCGSFVRRIHLPDLVRARHAQLLDQIVAGRHVFETQGQIARELPADLRNSPENGPRCD